MAKVKRNHAAESIAKTILENYNPESVEDMQDALKEIFLMIYITTIGHMRCLEKYFFL